MENIYEEPEAYRMNDSYEITATFQFRNTQSPLEVECCVMSGDDEVPARIAVVSADELQRLKKIKGFTWSEQLETVTINNQSFTLTRPPKTGISPNLAVPWYDLEPLS